MTIRDAVRRIAAGQATALGLTSEALARIAARNSELNAFLHVNRRAEADARRADRAVAAGRRLGPLHGVPISIKDIILTRDMPTTAGSRSFGDGLVGPVDAAVVRRLRRAGAVLIGKTNLHELAMGVTTVNEHFGPTRNPRDPARVPGGSSGGSAAAVADGMGLGSVGTDTRGSIRIPAACCGVVGLKPTYGLVDTEGVIPLSPSLDHVGPITTTVVDAALMLGAMAGTPRQAARWLAAAEARERPTLRLGVCDWWLSDLAPGVEAAVRDALLAFAEAGFELREVTVEGLAEAHLASGVITGAEALAFHQQRLEQNPEGIGPRVRARMQKAYDLTAVDYVRAQEAQAMVMPASPPSSTKWTAWSAPPFLPCRLASRRPRSGSAIGTCPCSRHSPASTPSRTWRDCRRCRYPVRSRRMVCR
jgi:aspartyl-tRNA(Asn)/glutamyl-tRNA(Gln) amidotransferase subunit A